MKSRILLILTLFCIGSAFGTFPKADFDSVIAYEIHLDKSFLPVTHLIGIEEKIKHSSISQELSKNQIERLIQILNDTLSYGVNHSFSHDPSVAFVFYKNNEVVDWVEIGFATNTQQSNSLIKAQNKYFIKINGEIECNLTGLSPTGRRELSGLIKEFGLNKGVSQHSQWDSVAIDHNKFKSH